MSSLLVQMSRKALTYNYKAQREVLRELRDCGHIVPKLNASQDVFNDFFLTTLASHNDYEQTRLGVDTATLAAQHNAALGTTSDGNEHLDNGQYQLSETAKACLNYDLLAFVYNVFNKLGYTLSDIYNITGRGPNRVARDFWLTRNNHGAGFWGGDYVQDGLGDSLTIIAEESGECCLWVGELRTKKRRCPSIFV